MQRGNHIFGFGMGKVDQNLIKFVENIEHTHFLATENPMICDLKKRMPKCIEKVSNMQKYL